MSDGKGNIIITETIGYGEDAITQVTISQLLFEELQRKAEVLDDLIAEMESYNTTDGMRCFVSSESILESLRAILKRYRGE